MKTIVTATSSITIKVEILFHIGFNVMGLHQRNREGEGVFFLQCSIAECVVICSLSNLLTNGKALNLQVNTSTFTVTGMDEKKDN